MEFRVWLIDVINQIAASKRFETNYSLRLKPLSARSMSIMRGYFFTGVNQGKRFRQTEFKSQSFAARHNH